MPLAGHGDGAKAVARHLEAQGLDFGGLGPAQGQIAAPDEGLGGIHAHGSAAQYHGALGVLASARPEAEGAEGHGRREHGALGELRQGVEKALGKK